VPDKPKPLQAEDEAAALSNLVRAVYLEGDVVLTRGERMIRASRLYYDFEQDKALILDAVMRAMEPARGIPMYVRARQVQQLSRREFLAKRPIVTTSEFYLPHYHIGADEIRVIDRTVRDAKGRAISLESADFEIKHATFNIEGVPILYWPYVKGNFRRSETGLRRARFGYSGDFGVYGQSRWYLFDLLGLGAPEGSDATLRLDYFGWTISASADRAWASTWTTSGTTISGSFGVITSTIPARTTSVRCAAAPRTPKTAGGCFCDTGTTCRTTGN